MYHIFVTFQCFPGKREAFVAKVKETGILGAIRKEAGCLRYEYYYPAECENTLLLIESWESRQHQQIHIGQPHMDRLRVLKGDYVETTTLQEFNLL